MTAEPIDRKRKLTVRTKLAFASGSLEEALVGAADVATILFYNQVMGLPAALCGTVYLIASIIDAFSDPLVGALSDSLPTRWGRRHPFMFASALPLGVFFYLLYQPPAELSQWQLFAWFAVTLVGVRLAMTFYSIPHSALGAELTDDYDERTSIFGWNWVVLSIGQALLSFFILAVIFPSTAGFENGLLNPDRYQFLAIFGGVFGFVVVLFCTFSTADQIPYLHDTQSLGDRTKRYFSAFLKDTLGNLWALLRNPSYISVVACWLILAITGGVLAVVATYTFIYAFEFSTEEIAIRAVIILPGAFVAVVLSNWFVNKLDKKYSVISLLYVVSFLIGLPYCLRLLGWLPENGSEWLLISFFGIWMLGYLFMPVISVVIDSQLVDITDEHELITGNRAEGIVFSIRTFAFKMSSGLGGLIAGFGLELIDFPLDAKIDALEPSVIEGLLWMMGPLFIVIVFAGTLFAFMYRIDRKRHAEILQELERRR